MLVRGPPERRIVKSRRRRRGIRWESFWLRRSRKRTKKRGRRRRQGKTSGAENQELVARSRQRRVPLRWLHPGHPLALLLHLLPLPHQRRRHLRQHHHFSFRQENLYQYHPRWPHHRHRPGPYLQHLIPLPHQRRHHLLRHHPLPFLQENLYHHHPR